MITRINNNRGRRFLNPLEVEAQYHTEDRAINPDLLLWIDFTDVNSLRGALSGGSTIPVDGEKIIIAENKSWHTPSGSVSAGEKALSEYVAQATGSKQPVWNDPEDGTPPYAYFDGDAFMMAAGSAGRSSASNFSTSTIESNKFSVYIVCEREAPSEAQRQDVLFITDKDSTNSVPHHWLSFYFDEDNKGIFEMYSSDLDEGDRYRYVRYDTADDENFHYHMFNAYETYSNVDNYASLQADGLFHQFADSPLPSPAYHKIISDASALLDGQGGSLTYEYDFSGTDTHHSSVTIGGQPKVGPSSGADAHATFKGKIYEILVFKSEHGGPNVIDVSFWGGIFKKRWSNMLYYLQRKYQYISVKI